MPTREERKAELKRKSAEARRKADQALEADLAELRNWTTTDLEKLLPKVSDPEAYAKLIAAVEESTRKNESLAELRQRVIGLGEGVAAAVKEAVRLAGGIT